MRTIPQTITDAWESGDFVGDQRARARVTVQRGNMKFFRDAGDAGATTYGNNFCSYLFNNHLPVREIPGSNIRSVEWDRTVDEAVASCRITIRNIRQSDVEDMGVGDTGQTQGWFSPQHGTTAFAQNRWGHQPSFWERVFMPDNIVKTYQGYGWDFSVIPSQDPNLVLTGVWRIDTVEMDSDGFITLSCRDLGSLLIDQILYPPVVPFRAGPTTETFQQGKYGYPIQFESDGNAPAAASDNNYADYSDVVKLFLGWAGFFWPSDAVTYDQAGNTTAYPYQSADSCPTLSNFGRIWGDFKIAGTHGVSNLSVDVFDKKPIMEGIQFITDILGFLFYVDETGGAIFRPPNIYELGNWLRTDSPESGTRVNTILELDEGVNLVNVSSVISGANLRERVFIANHDGSAAALAPGFNPNPTGLRRVGGWTDQGFASTAEAATMAEMITVRQMFRYREDTVRIAANPAIQVDDQVRIIEETTSEGYYHYVRSISSSYDAIDGTWHYNLETHWLGETPFGTWAFDRSQLSAQTQQYLANVFAS